MNWLVCMYNYLLFTISVESFSLLNHLWEVVVRGVANEHFQFLKHQGSFSTATEKGKAALLGFDRVHKQLPIFRTNRQSHESQRDGHYNIPLSFL